MLALEYDAELARQALLERGREEEKLNVIQRLLKMSFSMKEIARVVDWTEEEVRKFAEVEKNS